MKQIDYCILKGTENWIPVEEARRIRDSYRESIFGRDQIGLTSQRFANGKDKSNGYLAKVWIEKGVDSNLETDIPYRSNTSNHQSSSSIPVDADVCVKAYCICKGTENWIPSDVARELRDKYRSSTYAKNQIGLTSHRFANGRDKSEGYETRVWIEKGINPELETNLSYVPRASQILQQNVPEPEGKHSDEPEECMHLSTMGIFKKDKIQLSSKDKEVYNYHHLTALLSEYGFGCDWVRNDSNGADFLAYHAELGKVLKIQLKGAGLHIAKKYEGKGIHMACLLPDDKWALIPHDDLKSMLERLNPNAFTGQTWSEKGTYYINPPSAAHLAELAPYIL